MSNALNVTTGKPGKINGQIFRAPLGTALPQDAAAELDSAFKALGYISDAGIVNSNTASTSQIKAWGGDVVMDVQTEKPDTFRFTLIEALNPEPLKAVYGDENVTGDLANGIKIRANSKEQEECAWVIDMLARQNTLKRIVIAQGKVTTVGDITYKDDTVVGYETTVSCYPNEAQNGDTHQEFLVKGSDSDDGGGTDPAPTTYTVTFNTDGGDAVDPQTVTEGGKVTKPEDPEKSGSTFDGWYKEDTFATAWDFDNDTVTEDTTIYAKWS